MIPRKAKDLPGVPPKDAIVYGTLRFEESGNWDPERSGEFSEGLKGRFVPAAFNLAYGTLANSNRASKVLQGPTPLQAKTPDSSPQLSGIIARVLFG